jgi:DNA gyrase subunit B
LLTFFNNYPFYKLIENSKIFLAQPPLYRISKGTKSIYIKDDKELESFIIKSSEKSKKINKDSSKYKAFIDNEKSKMTIQRFKGLGEMNPEELWSTTLNPETRTLLKIEYSKQTKVKSKDDQKLIQTLMGNDVAPRKDFIISRALDVSNLDI